MTSLFQCNLYCSSGSFVPSGKPHPLSLSLYCSRPCLLRSRPLPLLPSGAQAIRGSCWWSVPNTCLIQCHFLLLIFSFLVQILALCLPSCQEHIMSGDHIQCLLQLIVRGFPCLVFRVVGWSVYFNYS